MSRPALGGKSWPLLRRYAPDVAVVLGTLAFVVVVGVLSLWVLRSR